MADTTYSEYCSRAWKPKGSSYTKQYRVRLDTTLNTYATYCNISYTHYLSLSSSVTHNEYHWSVGGYASGSGTVNSKVGSGNTLYYCTSGTSSSVTRTHVAQTIYVSGSLYASSSGGSNTWNNQTVTATKSYTVPALANYAISYNANGGVGTIANATKWYGETLTLSDGTGFTRANYAIVGWNTAADGTGTHYDLGSTYSVDGLSSLTLYAEWQITGVIGSVKKNNAWFTGIFYIKVNGDWLVPINGYVKVNGQWYPIIPPNLS